MGREIEMLVIKNLEPSYYGEEEVRVICTACSTETATKEIRCEGKHSKIRIFTCEKCLKEMNTSQMAMDWQKSNDMYFFKDTKFENCFEVISIEVQSDKYVVKYRVIDIDLHDIEGIASIHYKSLESLQKSHEHDWKRLVAECIIESMDIEESDFKCSKFKDLVGHLDSVYGVKI